MATEIQNLRRKARTAEALAESIQVQIAQTEWNDSHPGAKPLDVDRWSERTKRLGNILGQMLTEMPVEVSVKPVAEMDDNLESIIRDAQTRPSIDFPTS